MAVTNESLKDIKEGNPRILGIPAVSLQIKRLLSQKVPPAKFAVTSVRFSLVRKLSCLRWNLWVVRKEETWIKMLTTAKIWNNVVIPITYRLIERTKYSNTIVTKKIGKTNKQNRHLHTYTYKYIYTHIFMCMSGANKPHH